MPDLTDVVREQLSNPLSGWSMGSFGAIAEFHHVEGDPPASASSDLSCVTDRGGIRLAALEDAQPIAYETLSAKPHLWGQSVALCLETTAAAMNKRTVLTELGPDDAALRVEDEGGVLFDMGLGQAQVDFCIRTMDSTLIEALRAVEGRSLFEAGNPAMGAILSAHPHRVALTRLGRVEVFQKIGGEDTDGRSPEGPHTHVLPKLMRTGRTHSANAPIPAGLTPCGYIHPASPVTNKMGEDKAFDAQAFASFQALIDDWGVEDYLDAKRDTFDALRAKRSPDDHNTPATRLGRVGLRNAIRQWGRQNGDDDILRAWIGAFDREPVDTDEPA
ncbi:MAG: hypothetical protein AAF434_12755 [Pseudomonadota bacterium]